MDFVSPLQALGIIDDGNQFVDNVPGLVDYPERAVPDHHNDYQFMSYVSVYTDGCGGRSRVCRKLGFGHKRCDSGSCQLGFSVSIRIAVRERC